MKNNQHQFFSLFLSGAGGVKKPTLPPINPKTGKPFEGDEVDKNPFKNTGVLFFIFFLFVLFIVFYFILSLFY